MRRCEQEPGVNVCYDFATHVAEAITGPPPAVRIVIGVTRRDNTNLRLRAKGLLEQNPGTPRVSTFGHYINRLYLQVVLSKPVSQCDCRIVRSIPADQMRGNHLHSLTR